MSSPHATHEDERHFQPPDVAGLARELHLQLLRYIEAQYPIRHPSVVAERHALLETSGVISREPFIESLPGYATGPYYRDLALPSDITGPLEELASWNPSVIPPRLYRHQAQALEAFLGRDDDLIVVTGTGSGKTETFLLPILVRSFEEARLRSRTFQMPGMRALILYPMNALVNDQLTRLRSLFGNAGFVSWYKQRYGAKRPIRFGMYTSRSPYPGMMKEDKNRQQLLPLLEYYLKLAQEQPEQTQELKDHGRWPQLDLASLYQAVLMGKTHVGADDYELYTRHQMQEWCPDILITNYSMLEYMLMRPIERTIFQQTAEWLRQDRANTLLIVLDEAHLYSGVTGAEIALLLRRLQARLGVNRDRVRFILTSASLDTGDDGQRSIREFASTLAGVRTQRPSSFAVIQGQRVDAPRPLVETPNTPEKEAVALSAFDLTLFTQRATYADGGRKGLAVLAKALGWPSPPDCLDLPRYLEQELPVYLGRQLPQIQTFRELWKITASHAEAFQRIAEYLFPTQDENERGLATSALLSLAAAATSEDGRPLLPVRAHLFFRGLPPLYACINPHCSARRTADLPGEIGSLWLSPRLHCTCGARVYELFEHRTCGAIFLRAFSPAEPADFYWHEQGDVVSSNEGYRTDTLLLIGQPHPKENKLEPILLHLWTGRATPNTTPGRQQAAIGQGEDLLLVNRPASVSSANKQSKKGQAEEELDESRHWTSCPVCRKRLREGSITSLSTKGEQPFVNLVRRQFELQPPNTQARDAAPNMGRKVLLFSDGRQRAARLARNLPREVELDTFRQAILLAVHQRSQRLGQPLIRMDSKLYREFVAICAHYRLYFFDGESQEALLRQIAEMREDYEFDAELAESDDWEPAIPQGYRLALLRQVADRFYSMQRMCAAVLEPMSSSLRLLKKKPVFARLDDNTLRAFVVNWIEALLDKSAFDATIASWDRKNTVPGEGFALIGNNAQTESSNDAEKAVEKLFGYTTGELEQMRRALVDELCETKEGVAFLKPEKLALRLTLEDSWHQCSDCAQLTWLPLGGRCPNPRCGGSRLIQLPGNDPGLHARTDFYREPIRQVVSKQRQPIHLTAEEHTAQLSFRDAQQVSTTTEKYELRFQDIGISANLPAIDILSCTTTMEVGVDIGSLLGIGLRTMPPRRANYQQRAGRAGRRGSALATVLSFSENGSHDAHYFEHPNEMISGALPSPQISRINERLARRHIQAALLQTFFLEYLQGSLTVSARQYGYLAEALGTVKAFFTSAESYGLARFERWLAAMLEGDTPPLMQQIIAWLPDTIDSRPMTAPHKRDFVRSVARHMITDLRRVGEQIFPRPSSTSTAGSVQQFDQNADEMMLLDLLFEHGFLPTYAFPREVRSFVIEEAKQGSKAIGIKQRPQQSVDVALSEYAPGRELIVDKETYRVGGMYVDPFPGATVANRVPSLFKRARSTFVLCARCGYTQREKTSGDAGELHIDSRLCPVCQTPLAMQEILDPPGFAPERGRNLDPGQLRNDGSSQNGTLTQVQLVLPLTDKDDFARRMTGGNIEWSFAEHRELLIANRGMRNQGFSVCRSCGAATAGDAGWLHQVHERPFLVPGWMMAPRKCSSADGIWHGYLGHIFHSDLLLLRFHWPVDVAYQVGHPWMRDALDTLAQALLLAATCLLDIASSELQVGWSHTVAAPGFTAAHSGLPRMADFFLFDTLSGGAGYATQVGQHIEQLLSLTQNILDECPEQCERSCYRCLRTYANRIQHHHLDRRLAGTLLRAIVNRHAPAALAIEQQARQLAALSQFLELVGDYEYQREGTLLGMKVPMLLKSTYETYAIGTYPIQQERPLVAHPLDRLPAKQVRLFSDYELEHNLPQIAQSLLR